MDPIQPLVQAYADRFTSPEEALLAEIHRFTVTHHPHAHMLSGTVQGKFLAFLSTMICPSYVLEIGTFTGYSALCLATGLKPGGELHTLELRETDADTAQGYFDRSAFKNQIILHRGQAKEIIPTLTHSWDLVFIDADKTAYLDYYEMVLPQVRPGGWILADNVLFHGEVLADPITGKNAQAIQAFNEHVTHDNRTEQVLLTIRDGLLLIKKKG